MSTEPVNYLAQSDEEISNMQPPERVETPSTPEPAETVPDPVVDEGADKDPVNPPTNEEEPLTESEAEPPVVEDPPAKANPLAEADDGAPEPEKPEPEKEAPAADPDKAPKPDAETPPGSQEKPEAGKSADKKPKAPIVEAPPAPNEELLKGFWNELLGKPIRANGKDIQLKSPDEVKRAVQMGLNYTKNMQAMQPYRRIVKMLENNKLMDEGQLAYLIDLHQRKPEAIQKLLADSEFDANTVDAEKAASYVPSNHQVSDAEMQFQAVLDEVETSETGPELILEVARQWDDSSRQALYQDPRLLVEINKQKANGLYALISTELHRRQALGDLQGVPFLAAYEHVGKELHAKGMLVPSTPAETPQPVQAEQPRQPVETRVAAPKPKVANTARAKAASPTKETAAAVKTNVSPLAQSDDDFLKTMQGRV